MTINKRFRPAGVQGTGMDGGHIRRGEKKPTFFQKFERFLEFFVVAVLLGLLVNYGWEVNIISNHFVAFLVSHLPFFPFSTEKSVKGERVKDKKFRKMSEWNLKKKVISIEILYWRKRETWIMFLWFSKSLLGSESYKKILTSCSQTTFCQRMSGTVQWRLTNWAFIFANASLN